MKYTVLFGRIMFAFIFLSASLNLFSKATINFAASAGVQLAPIAVPLSGIIALLDGLSIALGYKAKLGTWLLVLFLVPVTFMMHNFWAATNPMTAQIRMVMFFKNISILGAALLIANFGSGPFSFDVWLAKRAATKGTEKVYSNASSVSKNQ